MNELFSRDPLDLSKADRARIVAALREQRERWNKAEAEGKKSAPKGASKAASKPASLNSPRPSLEDLGLKL